MGRLGAEFAVFGAVAAAGVHDLAGVDEFAGEGLADLVGDPQQDGNVGGGDGGEGQRFLKADSLAGENFFPRRKNQVIAHNSSSLDVTPG